MSIPVNLVTNFSLILLKRRTRPRVLGCEVTDSRLTPAFDPEVPQKRFLIPP